MNIIDYGKQVWDFVVRFLNLFRLRQPFNFIVGMSRQDCLNRLRHLEQPQTGFLNAISQKVSLFKEDNHVRFEVRIQRYGRGGVYSTAKATGTVISIRDRTGTTFISGTIRPGISILWFIVFALGLLVILLVANVPTLFCFYMLFLVLSFVFIVRHYRDYRKLENLIHDTFSDVVAVTNELS